jgi:hypothetical protein
MSRTFSIMAISTIGVIVAVFLAAASPASATIATSSAFQKGWQQALEPIEMGLVGHGYMVAFTGGHSGEGGHHGNWTPTVIDHRSCAPNCGTWNSSPSTNQPPPVSPGKGEGGVGTSSGTGNVRDHR